MSLLNTLDGMEWFVWRSGVDAGQHHLKLAPLD
jgi:hypothetical protein